MVEELSRARDPHEVEFGELPELTRALRALGSSRRNAGAMQAHFFRPLLEARRKAEDARSAAAKMRAFDDAALAAGLWSCVDRIVADWPDSREPARRAIRSQIVERVRDYENHLRSLRDAASKVESAGESERLGAWRAWTAELRGVYQCADRTWLAIESLVKSLSRKPSPKG